MGSLIGLVYELLNIFNAFEESLAQSELGMQRVRIAISLGSVLGDRASPSPLSTTITETHLDDGRKATTTWQQTWHNRRR